MQPVGYATNIQSLNFLIRRASYVKMNKLFHLNLFLHVVNKLINLCFFNKTSVTLSSKKNHDNALLHLLQPRKRCRYNCTMLLVKSVKKTKFNIPATRKHFWLNLFLKEPMRGCRDVRKSQVHTAHNEKVIAI